MLHSLRGIVGSFVYCYYINQQEHIDIFQHQWKQIHMKNKRNDETISKERASLLKKENTLEMKNIARNTSTAKLVLHHFTDISKTRNTKIWNEISTCQIGHKQSYRTRQNFNRVAGSFSWARHWESLQS